MSNVELARFLCAAMWHLASMVLWLQRGNEGLATKAEDKFLELVKSLDELEKGRNE